MRTGYKYPNKTYVITGLIFVMIFSSLISFGQNVSSQIKIKVIERYSISNDTCLMDRIISYKNGDIGHSFLACSMATKSGFINYTHADSTGKIIYGVKAIDGDTVVTHYDYSNFTLIKESRNGNTVRFKEENEIPRESIVTYDSLNRTTSVKYFEKQKLKYSDYFNHDTAGFSLIVETIEEKNKSEVTTRFFRERTRPIEAIEFWLNRDIQYGNIIKTSTSSYHAKHVEYTYDKDDKITMRDEYLLYGGTDRSMLGDRIFHKKRTYIYINGYISSETDYNIEPSGKEFVSDQYIFIHLSDTQ